MEELCQLVRWVSEGDAASGLRLQDKLLKDKEQLLLADAAVAVGVDWTDKLFDVLLRNVARAAAISERIVHDCFHLSEVKSAALVDVVFAEDCINSLPDLLFRGDLAAHFLNIFYS